MNTFSALCIAACVFMIFVGFSFGFVDAMGVFPVEQASPFDATDDSLEIVENLSQNITGTEGRMSWSTMWGIVTGAMLIGAIGISLITHTTNLIGVYIFGTFFWSSWINVVGILDTFDFLASAAGLVLLTMITVGMSIMFIGAIVGMLSGAHAMR